MFFSSFFNLSFLLHQHPCWVRFDWFEFRRSRDQVRARTCPHPTAIIASGYHSYVEIASGYNAPGKSISPQGDTLIGCYASPSSSGTLGWSLSVPSPRTQVPQGSRILSSWVGLEPKSLRDRGFSALLLPSSLSWRRVRVLTHRFPEPSTPLFSTLRPPSSGFGFLRLTPLPSMVEAVSLSIPRIRVPPERPPPTFGP